MKKTLRSASSEVQGRSTGAKPINLALQGGGAHGAFTWGVLDALLADGRLSIEAITGTSAGAMNAVVLADGLARGGVEGARRRLAAFWRRVSMASAGVGEAAELIQSILAFWRFPNASPFGWLQQFSDFASPYRTNPLNINPLRDLVARMVDFERVRTASGPRLYIAATNVLSGKIKVFSDAEITADAVMASACLPDIFRAVEIDGESYWDGGYMGNPPLFPLFETGTQDTLLVQVNPLRRNSVPTSGSAIAERIAEITFNASLLREYRAIDFVNRLMDESRLDPAKYRRNRLHRIDAMKALANYGAASKLDTSWRFFRELHAAGRAAARDWLETNYAAIGVAATLDLRAEFM